MLVNINTTAIWFSETRHFAASQQIISFWSLSQSMVEYSQRVDILWVAWKFTTVTLSIVSVRITC